MLFTTPTQYAALAIALIAGWLFGLASHPGGRRWKQRYAEERDAHATSRKDYDTRYADGRRDQDQRLADANARVAELERENARLAKAAPVTVATIAPDAAARSSAVPARDYDTRVRDPRPYQNRGGWFGWKNRVGTNG